VTADLETGPITPGNGRLLVVVTTACAAVLNLFVVLLITLWVGPRVERAGATALQIQQDLQRNREAAAEIHADLKAIVAEIDKRRKEGKP